MSRTCIDCCVLSSRIIVLAAMLVTFAGCESQALRSPTAPAVGSALAASQSSERCVNVSAAGTASLGLVTLPNGTSGFGGTWFPVTLGGLRGEMASVVVSQKTSGEGGALHLTLEHAFRLPSGQYS